MTPHNRKTQQSRLQLANAIEGPRPVALPGRRRHMVRIVVHLNDSASDASACQRVHNWLETFGHTSVSHGFEFLETE